MFGIFQAIGDFFNTIFAIINLVVTILLAVVQYVFTALSLLTNLIGWIPVSISVPLFIVLILSVVFKILGRQSSGDN